MNSRFYYYFLAPALIVFLALFIYYGKIDLVDKNTEIKIISNNDYSLDDPFSAFEFAAKREKLKAVSLYFKKAKYIKDQESKEITFSLNCQDNDINLEKNIFKLSEIKSGTFWLYPAQPLNCKDKIVKITVSANDLFEPRGSFYLDLEGINSTPNISGFGDPKDKTSPKALYEVTAKELLGDIISTLRQNNSFYLFYTILVFSNLIVCFLLFVRLMISKNE